MWQFSDHFASSQRARVERLNSWRSYSDVVNAVVESASLVTDPICWARRDKQPTDAHRIQAQIVAAADAVDALFNSPCGYRAMFAMWVERGEDARRLIVDAPVAKLWHSRVQLPPDALLSLTSGHAKVWMIQDKRLTAAIKGEHRGRTNVEMANGPWIGQLEMRTKTSRGTRWFACGGVLTSEPPTRCWSS